MNKQGVNLNDEIKNIVQNALNNKDFNSLNKDVKNFVKNALDEAKLSINSKQAKTQSQSKNFNVKEPKKSDLKNNRYIVPIGKVSSVLQRIFGTIGMIAFGIAVFVLTLIGFTTGQGRIFYTIAIGISPFLIGSIIFYFNGIKIRKRLKRLQKYMSYLKGRSYSSIKGLASAGDIGEKAVIKDLKKMIEIGIFPQGHIDESNTYFILNNETYEQYLKLQKGIELERMKNREEENSNDLDSETRKAIEEGNKFIADIKSANKVILGEEISKKLDKLEDITKKIFEYVQRHPEKLPEIKKFTEYFLPTTMKLIDAYKKLDYQSIQGSNIRKAKHEIEDTMDTINLAFENLLDSLFVDIAMDISTDISVLQTLFKQEGLTEDEIQIKTEKRDEDE